MLHAKHVCMTPDGLAGFILKIYVYVGHAEQDLIRSDLDNWWA